MADFYIGQGNTSPPFPTRLEDDRGDPIDLTDATVTFSLVRQRDWEIVIVSHAAQILVADPEVLGEDEDNVQYAFTAEQTAVPGIYLAQWKVTTNDGAASYYPNGGYDVVVITHGLEGV